MAQIKPTYEDPLGQRYEHANSPEMALAEYHVRLRQRSQDAGKRLHEANERAREALKAYEAARAGLTDFDAWIASRGIVLPDA